MSDNYSQHPDYTYQPWNDSSSNTNAFTPEYVDYPYIPTTPPAASRHHTPGIRVEIPATQFAPPMQSMYHQNTTHMSAQWSPSYSSPSSSEYPYNNMAGSPFSSTNTGLLYDAGSLHPHHGYVQREPFSPDSAFTSSSSQSSHLFPTNTATTSGSSPSTPSSQNSARLSEDGSPQLLYSIHAGRQLYSHKEQSQMFRDACNVPLAGPPGPFVPQGIYKPHTESDRRRYVEEAQLEAPIKYGIEGPTLTYGISLTDAMHSRTRQLQQRDDTIFHGRGPSVSIRINWPGYRPWSKQIPTRDFRKNPGPITRTKLAKGIAKSVQKFITEKSKLQMEDDADLRWRVGPGFITLDDIILVSVHHVSMGSWQPQLRLNRMLPAA